MSSAGGTLDAESETHMAVSQDADAIKSPDLATSNHDMQPAPSLSNQVKVSAQDDTVGHDSSHLLQEPEASSLESTATVQQISDNREPSYTRQEPTTTQIRQPENSTITSLKHEHSSRTQSPLRESSVPVPSTEMTAAIAPPAPPKRSHKKKGVAAAAVTKRSAAAPAKRSHKKKVVASSTATPAQSSPAPRSVRTASSPARSSPDVDGNGDQHFSGDEGEEEEGGVISDTDLYCLCRRPDTGTFMIGCDGGCDDWFHGKCVNISEKWKSLIDKYICPFCTEKGLGETTWKRMCRRTGCGMPALVNKHSKFCSDRCGQLFFRALVTEQTRQPVVDTASRSRRGQQATTDDLGARGGLISISELKSIVTARPTVEALHTLNNGPVSPMPGSSPNAIKDEGAEDDIPLSHESALNDIERERIDQITHLKAFAHARHSLLRDRSKFVAMLKTVASRLADHRNVKPKDLCGYDSRLSWSEEEFDEWRASAAGKEALQIGSLPLPSTEDVDGDVGMSNTNDPERSTCMKKKCNRHYEWAKLHMEDFSFETKQNSAVIYSLEKEEEEIIERARLRAREIRAGGVGGTVEFHGLSAPKENKEDRELGVGPVVEERHDQHSHDVEMKEEKIDEGMGAAEEKTVEGMDVEEEIQADEEDKEVDMVDAIAASI
ncbi:unnamed protein product [Aureobasidium vineae]|uniref:PHD-type domain-containing protein n=1 Tax=Aureobasidium vineae TaxID=2773715 RepID=A0A9N8JRX3_9PEZI|nr:unnamed protein product [Aureobasidium vineae]